MFVRENRHAPNCYAKLNHSKQLLKNIHPVMLAHFCSWRKDIYSAHTVNTKVSPTICNCSNQEQSHRDKTLRTRSTFRQSLVASVGESQVVEKTQVWYLSITESRLLGAAIIIWCCYKLQLFLSATRSIWRNFLSSLSISRTVPGAHDARSNRLFLPITSPDTLILKILSRQTQQ